MHSELFRELIGERHLIIPQAENVGMILMHHGELVAGITEHSDIHHRYCCDVDQALLLVIVRQLSLDLLHCGIARHHHDQSIAMLLRFIEVETMPLMEQIEGSEAHHSSHALVECDALLKISSRCAMPGENSCFHYA